MAMFNSQMNCEFDSETKENWSKLPMFDPEQTCQTVIFGYESFIGYGLAVKASLIQADWSDTKLVARHELRAQAQWGKLLDDFIQEYNLDVGNLDRGWQLVCLYF
jgi:hypothetical protein